MKDKVKNVTDLQEVQIKFLETFSRVPFFEVFTTSDNFLQAQNFEKTQENYVTPKCLNQGNPNSP